MKSLLRWLLFIHGFVGIGALFGGMAGILSPSGSGVGLSVNALKNGPFSDFFIPGLFLFVIIGIGNIIAAITTKYNYKYQAYISACHGGILSLWIIIQCYMLNAINILHVIYFIIGIILIVLATKLAFKKELYIANIIIKHIKKDEREFKI